MRVPLLLTVVAALACASRPADGVFAGTPNTDKSATLEDGTVFLYGPIDVPDEVRAPEQTVYVVLEDLTFAPDTGNSSMYWLVDGAAAKGSTVVIDETLYVGSAANVHGMATGPMLFVLEVNDFDVDGTPHLPLTRLREMKTVVLAQAVGLGAVKFKRAYLTTKNPRGDTPPN
jgi:hypothetical protein